MRLTAVITVLAGTMIGTATSAAASGPGTFTKITTPSTTKVVHFDANPGATNHFTVSGQTSTDVTSVDVGCTFVDSTGDRSFTALATAVPVSGGAFSAIATIPNLLAQCRLRALPTGTSTTGYLGSYSGPLLYSWTTGLAKDSAHVVTGALVADEKNDGIAAYEDISGCDGVLLTGTVELPNMVVEGGTSQECVAGPSAENVTTSGSPDASSLKVDGHSAYWPPMVASYLIGDRSLPVTQSALAVTFQHLHNGDLTMTASGPLMRCSVSDHYPPTSTSCPSLVSTGVRYQRVVSFVDDSHQVRIADSYTSTAGTHKVAAQYVSTLPLPPTGASGYQFPGHSGTFRAVTSSQRVTGLGSRAGTILQRSDVHATEGDGQAGTTGLSYSRAPANVLFAHTSSGEPDQFALPYTLKVPAKGTASLALVVSAGVTTAAVKKLSAGAVTDFVAAPVITTPKNHATVHGHKTTVKGTAAAGANGLPVSVKLNGHKAALTKSGSFSVSLHEPFGQHKLTAVATDVAGGTRSSSITVTNKS